MKRLMLAAAIALAGCGAPPAQEAARAPAEQGAPGPDVSGLPAGSYRNDPAHTSLSFRVDHLGFSHYTARFTGVAAELQLDPANPTAASLIARVDARSLTLDNPPAGFLDDLLGPQWLDTARFDTINFRSTGVAMTGPASAEVSGDLTLHGVTRPVTLAATFNGGWAGIPQDPNARLGFSAHGTLSRSAFGVDIGLPPPGSNLGVGDAVAFAIEAEFIGPPMQPDPAGQPQSGQ